MLDDERAHFTQDDVDTLVSVLGIVPELVIAAAAVKRRRQLGLEYPMTSTKHVSRLYDNDQTTIGGHRVAADTVERYLADAYPIENDEELARAVYLALNRCNSDVAWALQGPTHGKDLIQEIETLQGAAESG